MTYFRFVSSHLKLFTFFLSHDFSFDRCTADEGGAYGGHAFFTGKENVVKFDGIADIAVKLIHHDDVAFSHVILLSADSNYCKHWLIVSRDSSDCNALVVYFAPLQGPKEAKGYG